jgi:hypothetical protein
LGIAGGGGRDFAEVANEENAPGRAEEEESGHDAKHGRGIETVRRGEIGVDGERSAIEKNKKDAAAEPTHLCAEKANGLVAMFGGEPIGFVGQVQALRWLGGENARDEEGDEGGSAKDHGHEHEEGLLRLKAVGSAVGGKVPSHHVGQLRIDMEPLQKAKSQHQEKDELGKARVVHGRTLQLRVERKLGGSNDCS